MFGNGKNERPAVKGGGERGLVCWRGQRGISVQNFIGQKIKGHAHLSLVC